MSEGESVQVAVRMRVFNGREKAANAERIVRMETLDKGSKTYIMDPDTKEEREYKYDYSFQSHSETDTSIGPYATQDTVMQTLGIPVLNAALEGRNVSLFAYGQTGAGKSFSMLGKVGIPEHEGIIPRTCREIFRRLKEDLANPNITTNVDIQVVEVYCEQVNDLLADRKNWPPQGHKPRLTPKDGYVVDTITKPCGNYEDIGSAMEFADKNRSVGSHALNPESSRAHTIYQINYSKVVKGEAGGKGITTTAKLNLIDLAGSERTESAGTTGQMLKEGNAINLSLTALGGCIKALSEGKKPGFRDSKLTLLLQASMTSGRVIMIAALSPASICYAETLSTLKFADRIKTVKIKSTKNVSEDPVAEIKKAMEQMRNKMQEEIDALRISLGLADGAVAPSGEIEELENMLKKEEETINQLKETAEQRAARSSAINKEWSGALGGASMKRKEDEKRPHFVNLHEDERIAETLIYGFDVGETVIGKANPEKPPKVELGGLGITKDHCTVIITPENDAFIEIHNNSRTLVNGQKLKPGIRVPLVHQNRVWLGNNYAFRFCHPGMESKGEKREKDPDYFVAEAEISQETPGMGDHSDKDPEAMLLRHKLAEAQKKVDQANLITTDLERDVIFSPKLFENRSNKETDVVVQVQIGSQSFVWPWSKFSVRLADMVTVWTEWQHCDSRGEKMRDLEPQNDPFVDMESQLIGETDVWLNALSNMVEFAAEASVISVFGQVQGKVAIELNPCDANGNTGPWEDENEDLDPFTDNPEELLNKDIQFEIKVNQLSLAMEVCGDPVPGAPTGTPPECRFSNVFVRYKFNPDDDTEEFSKTREDANKKFGMNFNYSKKHKVKVTKDILQHLLKGKMTFQVWGSVVRGGTSARAQSPAGGDASNNRMEAKKKQLDELEAKVVDLQSKLEKKNAQINEKNKVLMDLEKKIVEAQAAKKK